MMTRREFLKNSALAALFAQNNFLNAAQFEETIGLQLYTVRKLMQTDVFGTLKQVAKVGYKEVEFAGYFDIEPGKLKKALDEVGLKARSTHISIEDIGVSQQKTIEIAHMLEHQYVVCPGFTLTEPVVDSFKSHASLFNKIGEGLKKAGIQFAFHNHDLEFKKAGNQIPFDILLAETDPNFVQFELDLYWIIKGGQDPLTYFEKYPGRFPLWHVKDMDQNGMITDVGKGKIDFTGIFSAAKRAGMNYYFVEHDEPANPLKSIAASFEYLNRSLRNLH